MLLPGKKYHEVIFVCDPGYRLSDTGAGHMFCQQGGWMGVHPYCEEDPEAADAGTGPGSGDERDGEGCGDQHEWGKKEMGNYSFCYLFLCFFVCKGVSSSAAWSTGRLSASAKRATGDGWLGIYMCILLVPVLLVHI